MPPEFVVDRSTVTLLDTSALLARAEAVLDRLEGYGLKWRHTRFERYRAQLERLVTTPLDSLNDAGQALFYEATTQFYHLSQSLMWWGSVDQAELSARLKHVLDGQDLPVLRTGEDRPRNTLFELITATQLHARRFGLELAEPDIVAHRVDIGQAFVACKRPSSVRTSLPKRLKEGRRQVDGRGGIGIVAVDGTRMAGVAGHVHVMSDLTDADGDIHDRIRFLRDSIAALIRDHRVQLYPEVAGVAVILTPLYWLRDSTRMYLPGLFGFMTALPTNDPRIAAVARDLDRAFRGSEPELWLNVPSNSCNTDQITGLGTTAELPETRMSEADSRPTGRCS